MKWQQIDKSTLKEGDVIGIPEEVRLGWTIFRYYCIVPKTIKRITPARTKFIMTDGSEYTVRYAFCSITPDTERMNVVADAAKKIDHYLFEIDNHERNGELYKKDDDTLLIVADLLGKVAQALNLK